MFLARPPRECPERHPVRLACIRRAASVDPEPGSNSPPRSHRNGIECCVLYVTPQPDRSLRTRPLRLRPGSSASQPPLGHQNAAAPASLRCSHPSGSRRTRESPPLGGGNQLDPDTSGSGEGRLDKTTYATLASSWMPASRLTGHFCWAFAQQPAEFNALGRPCQPIPRTNFSRWRFCSYPCPVPRNVVFREGANELVIT